MFTGIVIGAGNVAALHKDAAGARLRIRSALGGGPLVMGESIAVQGVCLTVTRRGRGWFEADCMHETLRVTTLGDLVVGSPVNLERSLRADDRLGGHFVQGHVDGVGTVRAVRPDGDSRVVSIVAPATVRPYLVYKGSVAIDGVSLTVSAVRRGHFEVSLIPHTLEVTTLSSLRPGDRVNLEADVLAKYLHSFLAERPTPRRAPRRG